MSNLVIDTLCKEIKEIYNKKASVWKNDILTDKDKNILQNEAYEVSKFDKLNLKKEIYDKFLNGSVQPIVKKMKNARIVILTENIHLFFPWHTWGRLFQWMGKPKDSNEWQIYLYASQIKRILPKEGDVGPEHLNGGYTYPCKSDCVVIYRYEEATRVMIHELLHAACTDDFSKSVEFREASTELWAELFLVTLLSKGNIDLANKLWLKQDNYIQDLNATLYNFYNVKTYKDYGARYTILRISILESLRINLDSTYNPKRIHISRFTSPELDNYLE
jgi:hypothetical protein